MKKILSCILAIILFISVFGVFTANAGSLSLSAESAILIDADSGRVLYQKNAFVRLPMASTTKIMTALVAIESGNIDRAVKIDNRARGVEGSSIYLADGEVLSMRDLVYALLLASANDAAAAIAFEISGSIEDFAILMNQKADELGLTSTHFVNPHGLHAEEHYTTAYDLAKITAEALKNEIFLEICSSKTKKIPLNVNEGTRYLTNHNKLLRSYNGCIGVKTGFTKKSGRCLVSAAEREGLRLVAVTLNAPDDWRDHTAMLDFGFERYTRLDIAKPGAFSTVLPLSGGDLPNLTAVNRDSISALLTASHGEISHKIEAIRPLTAPVKDGDIVGRVIFYENGKEIAASPLIAENGVKAAPQKFNFFEWLKRLFNKK